VKVSSSNLLSQLKVDTTVTAYSRLFGDWGTGGTSPELGGYNVPPCPPLGIMKKI